MQVQAGLSGEVFHYCTVVSIKEINTREYLDFLPASPSGQEAHQGLGSRGLPRMRTHE